MLSIIDRYLIREIVQTWLLASGLLLVILMSNRFALLLGEAAAGKLPAFAVLTLLGLVSVNYLVVLIPVALFLAMMVTLGRLYRDGEMTTMMACGVGPRRLYRPLLAIAGILAALVAVLSLEVAPWSVRMSHLVRQQAERQAEFGDFQAGRFKTSSSGQGVFYAEQVSADAHNVRNVFIQRYHQGKVTVVTAASGERVVDPDTGIGMLVLHDGHRYEGTPGQANFRETAFESHGIHIEPTAAVYNENSPEVLSNAALIRQGTPKAWSELQWRISVPVSALLLTLLAVPLSRTAPRQGRYGRLLVAILVYLIYSNLISVARVWYQKGVTPHVIGIWWVHALMLSVIVVMLARQNGLFWRLRARWHDQLIREIP